MKTNIDAHKWNLMLNLKLILLLFSHTLLFMNAKLHKSSRFNNFYLKLIYFTLYFNAKDTLKVMMKSK